MKTSNAKSILFLFRGNDASQRVMSATKSQYEKSKLEAELILEFINLDKRNIDKLLCNGFMYDFVFVYHDEENTIETLSRYFDPDMIISYNRKDSVDYVDCSHPSYGARKSAEYVLINKILAVARYGTPTEKVYKIDHLKNIVPEAMYLADYKKVKDKGVYFLTEKDAVEKLLNDEVQSIKWIDAQIKDLKADSKNHKKNIEALQVKLDALDKLKEV